MCGIVGYTGHLQAAPILLDGLSKLEYRGYDSAGLAVRNGVTPGNAIQLDVRDIEDIRLKRLIEKQSELHQYRVKGVKIGAVLPLQHERI